MKPLTAFLLAGIIWTGPKLTPQQAADVLRPHQHVATPRAEGPTFVVFGGTPGAPTWMTFPPPTPAVRLDGTPLTQPPAVYGGWLGDHRGRRR